LKALFYINLLILVMHDQTGLTILLGILWFIETYDTESAEKVVLV